MTFNIFAQDLQIQAGRNLSIFDYKNSEGEKLNNLKSEFNFVFSGQYRFNFKNPLFHVATGFSYNRYSSEGSDTIHNNFYSWQTDYLGIHISGDISLFRKSFEYGINKKYFFIDLVTDISTEFLIKGSQKINSQTISLIGVEQFNRPFFFVRGGISLNYYINKNFGVYCQYLGGRSVWIIDKDKTDLESLNIISHSVYVGFSFRLPY